MITQDQIAKFVKKYKINETVIVREYYQLLFLSSLYTNSLSQKIYFKGGTAIRLIYEAPRFSEDLDFTVGLPTTEFAKFIEKLFVKLSKEESVSFKERKTISGKRFLLTAEPTILSYKIFINLDFSFREKVMLPAKSIIKTEYPVLFNNYVSHLQAEEIFAEKIRAMLTRKKGRDIYDLWFLLNKNVSLQNKLVKEKLKYYKLKDISRKQIIDRLKEFRKQDFILDLRPFIPFDKRDQLGDFFDFIKEFLLEKLK